MKFLRYTALIGTIIVYFNLVFYRSFTDFITIPQLFQGSNIGDLGSSILTLIEVYDVFFFLDVVIIWYLSKKNGCHGRHISKTGEGFLHLLFL